MNIDINKFEKSQYALRDYMYYKPGNKWMHTLTVLSDKVKQLSIELIATGAFVN